MSFLETKIPPPIVGLLFILIMWLASQFGPSFSLPASVLLPMSGLIVLLGFAFPIAGSMAFKKAKTTVNPLQPEKASKLVILGIFRYSRNPMYLGLSLVLVAWGLYLSSYAALALVPVFMLYINTFQILPEERALKEKFGSDFEDYQNSVGKWL